MGVTLTGKRVQNTYDSLLKLSDNDNLTGTAKVVGDGLGNDSPIYLSTSKVGIGVTPTYQFQTSGNAKIGANLIVGGNLTVNGSTTIVDSTIVAIGDNMIEMAKDNVSNTMDIGWYGTIVESGTKYVGINYDAGSGITTPTFYIGLGTTEPSSTAEWTVKGKLVIGAIDSTGGTFSGQITIPQTPTADGHAASKKYVDDQIGGADKARRVTITVKNTETVALSAGTVVHAEPTASPPSGNIVQVKKADYDTASLMPAIGILNEDLDAAGGTNDEGEAIMFGFINGINTSSFSAGDELYVGNDGALTNSKPLLTTQLIQKIAVVMKVDSTNGSIEVFGAGRSNDVPNEVDRDLSIAGDLTVDDTINVESSTGFGNIEIGGPSGGYIDLKAPFSDDYDIRIITSSGGNEITTASGDLKINTGNTLALTLDGSTQDATFAGSVDVNGSEITVGTNNSRFAENNLRFLSSGAAYIDHNTVGQSFIFRTSASSSLDTTALTIASSGNATFAGDITVSGGDIILGGTGRIQGVDTVSAGTDAANKDYVDNAVGGKVDGSGTANYIPKWSDSDTLTNSAIYDNGSDTRCTDDFEVYRTAPVLKLNDTNATTTTNQTGYISYRINGTESGWVGFGSSSTNEFGIRNTNGPIVLNPSTNVETKQYLKINNVGGDRKIEFNRTGGNQFSIEHDSSQIYFYNATTAKSALLIENGGQVFINPGLVNSNALKVYWDMKLYNTLNLTNSAFTVQGSISGSNGALSFNANGSLAAYINSSQRVGIGTSTDIHSLLTLSGNTNSYTTAPIISFNSTSTANANVRNWAIGPADSAYGNFHIYKSSARGESAISTAEAVMVIDYTGKVGIGVGTYTVSEKLDVHGNAYLVGVGSALKFDTTGGNGTNGIKTINDYETLIYNGRGAAGHIVAGNSSIRLGFGTNYTDAQANIYIEHSSDSVGINNSIPDSFYSGARSLVVGDGSGEDGITIYGGSDSTSYLLFADGTSGSATYAGQVRYVHSANTLEFATGNVSTRRMVIDNVGRVGIGLGSNTPGYRLDVTHVGADAINVNASTDFTGIRWSSNAHTYSWRVGGGTFFIYDVNNAAQRVTLDTSGNLRVGGGSHYTGTGITSLTVNNDLYPTFALGSTTGNRYAMIAYSSAIHSYSTSAPFVYSIGGSEKMRLTADGILGINKSSGLNAGGFGSPKIVIKQSANSEWGAINIEAQGNDSVFAMGTSNDEHILAGSYRATAGFKDIVIKTSSQNRLRVRSGGNILIGTDLQYFSEKLLVNGMTRTVGLHIAGGIGYSNYANFVHNDNDLTISTNRVSGSGDITLQPYGDVRVEGASLWLNEDNAAANYYLRLNKRDGQDGGILWYRSNSLDFQVVNSGSSGNLIWYSYGTSSTVMTLDKSTGHLTIGDSSYSASNGRTLQVVNSSASVMSHVSYDTVLIQQNDAPTLRIFENGENISTTISSDAGNSTMASSTHLRFFTGGSYVQTAYNGLLGNHVMTMDSSGRVLIGQTSNQTNQKLQVNGFIDITSTTKAIRWYDGTTFVGGLGSGQWAFSSTYADDLSVYANSDLLFHAGIGSTIDMFIQGSTHRVGMGPYTYSPSAKLDVRDTSDAQLALNGAGTTWAGIRWDDANGTAYSWFYGGTQTWAFGGGGSAVSGKRIHCDGGMTIGANYDSVTMPTNGLWVQGTIKCADDLVAFDSSDKRLKDNIRKIEKPLEKLDKINGYKFKWNTKQDIHEGEDYGVIAQEVEEIMPEIVNLKESGYYGVKYDKLIPLLIESVKELKAEIRDLKKCNCNCK